MLTALNKVLKGLGVLLIPFKTTGNREQDVKELEKAILEKLRSGELPADDYTPIPPRFDEGFEEFCKKYGQCLAEIMYLQHMLTTVLRKVGPLEISDQDWNNSDPEGVLTFKHTMVDESTGAYKLELVVDKNVERKISNTFRSYYDQFERQEVNWKPCED